MARLADQLVTQSELAEAVGLTARTLRDIETRGIELPRDRHSKLYRVGPCIKALRAYWEGRATRDPEEALDYNAERARLTKHQADRAQLKYEAECGRLVGTEGAQLALECILVPVRQYLIEQGSRLAPILAGQDAPTIEAQLDRENAKELRKLANPVLEFTGQPEPDDLDLLPDDPDSPEPATGEDDPPGAEEPGASG